MASAGALAAAQASAWARVCARGFLAPMRAARAQREPKREVERQREQQVQGHAEHCVEQQRRLEQREADPQPQQPGHDAVHLVGRRERARLAESVVGRVLCFRLHHAVHLGPDGHGFIVSWLRRCLEPNCRRGRGIGSSGAGREGGGRGGGGRREAATYYYYTITLPTTRRLRTTTIHYNTTDYYTTNY